MSITERVLCVSLNSNQIEDPYKWLYRIQRGKRIVYVKILHDGILQLDHCVRGAAILSQLRHLPRWNENWTTLTVQRDAYTGQIKSLPDWFGPHSVNVRALKIYPDSLTLFDIANLQHWETLKDRVTRVVLSWPPEGQLATAILKIANFAHDLPYLMQEIEAYTLLMESGCTAVPGLLGYVYEEHTDRVVGILIEDVVGRPAGIEDLEACQDAVRRLHNAGIIHGDLNSFNFLVSETGATIIDFETAKFADCYSRESARQKAEEMKGLEDKLRGVCDESPPGVRYEDF